MIIIVVLYGKGLSSSLKGYSTIGPIYNMDEVSTKPLAKTYRYYFFE
jgi:hypothetical protein